jgi:cyclohexanecarboxylate-CoA ligase
VSIRATHRPPARLVTRYRRPGGPWDVETLDHLLTGRHPRSTVLVDGRFRFRGGALDEWVGEAAGALRAAGVRAGTAVAWQLPNCADAVVLFRACWRVGAIAVPVHHRFSPNEASSLANRVGARLLLRTGDLDRLPLGESVPLGASGARPEKPAAVLFTAGSSGSPKGVIHTHRALAHKAIQLPAVHGLGAADVTLMPAPLAHISGLLNGIVMPGALGMGSVLMDRWDPDRALDLVASERVSFMVGPPTFFIGLLGAHRFAPERVNSLRLISCGGTGVTPDFVRDATTALGARVKRTYGSTESPTVATSRAEDPSARAAAHDGRALPDVELRVVDPATGTDQPPSTPGELWVRGPELFAGYLDPDRTANAFAPAGWFRTGDLATLDADGWLTITGRLKDIIIRGGENIAAAEIEADLASHPAVRDVAVVSEPDDRLGERAVAFVELDPDTSAGITFDLDACRRWFAELGVALFKTPERVVVVAALPRLSSGEVDKQSLRRRPATT